MFLTILLILGGLLLLAAGAESLVRGSAGAALRFGVTPMAIGLTVVAFGTGSPELAVSVEAAYSDNGGIALGNVVGSNITNVLLILGVSALVRPMRVRSELIRREVPVMILVSLLLCLLLLDGVISRLEGLLLTTGSIAYTILAYVFARRSKNAAVASEFAEAMPGPGRMWMNLIFILAGLIALLAGAKLLLTGAVVVAEKFGISQVVIGLTVIAIGTSLPELATSLVAAVKREPDVALGNVIGSNILNILCILGVAALIRPIQTQGLRILDLTVLLASALLILPLLWRGSVLNRWEGAVLLVAYSAYIYSLVP